MFSVHLNPVRRLLCCVVMCACRLPHLSTISIKLSGSSHHCDLDPVLCQMQVHATGLRCLSLQLGTSWTDQTDACWASLGKMTNLTRLQLTFQQQVRQARCECEGCGESFCHVASCVVQARVFSSTFVAQNPK